MNVYCHNCSFQNKYSTSCKSNTKAKVSDVNLRGTLAIISAGGGHSFLKKFCSTMDFLPPVASHHTTHTYENLLPSVKTVPKKMLLPTDENYS